MTVRDFKNAKRLKAQNNIHFLAGVEAWWKNKAYAECPFINPIQKMHWQVGWQYALEIYIQSKVWEDQKHFV